MSAPHGLPPGGQAPQAPAALDAELKVADLPAMDLSYPPPFGAPWEAVQGAADGRLADAGGAGCS